MKKTIEVQLEDKKITISRLPLGKYAEVLNVLKELPKMLPEFTNRTSDELLARLPQIIAKAWPDAMAIMLIATPLPKEEIEMLRIDDAVKIAIAIYNVNNFKEVYEELKKVLARPDQKKSVTGSTAQ